MIAHKAELNKQIAMLTNQRQQLRNKSRSIKGDEKLAAYKGEISGLSESLEKLRRGVWLCEDIQERSGIIKEKLRRERDDMRKNVQIERSPQNQSRMSR